MQSQAKTVDAYLAELPEERRESIEAVRRVILANLGPGYEERMQYGMIGYVVPHSLYPPGYHVDSSQPIGIACLASQKNHLSLYLTCVYGDTPLATWFQAEWKKTGKKLDMGKSCIRFKSAAAVPLEVIGEAIRRVPVKKLIEIYERALTSVKSRPRPVRKVKKPGS